MSDIEVGQYYLKRNGTPWPRRVLAIAHGRVLYVDYASSAPAVCTYPSFREWAAKPLTPMSDTERAAFADDISKIERFCSDQQTMIDVCIKELKR